MPWKYWVYGNLWSLSSCSSKAFITIPLRHHFSWYHSGRLRDTTTTLQNLNQLWLGNGQQSKGFLIMMGTSPLSWSSKQQAVVTLSSCEAEYLATTHCTHDILWFWNLFTELSFPQTQLTSLFCDNQGTVAYMHDPHAHSKMNHISIHEHFIHNCVVKCLINVIHVSNKENITNLLTKSLHCTLHICWIKML